MLVLTKSTNVTKQTVGDGNIAKLKIKYMSPAIGLHVLFTPDHIDPYGVSSAHPTHYFFAELQGVILSTSSAGILKEFHIEDSILDLIMTK